MACTRCGCGITKPEDKIVLNKTWHKCCFNCYKCGKNLRKDTAIVWLGEIFCNVCRPPECCDFNNSTITIGCKTLEKCSDSKNKCKSRSNLLENSIKCFTFPLPWEVANFYNRNHMRPNLFDNCCSRYGTNCGCNELIPCCPGKCKKVPKCPMIVVAECPAPSAPMSNSCKPSECPPSKSCCPPKNCLPKCYSSPVKCCRPKSPQKTFCTSASYCQRKSSTPQKNCCTSASVNCCPAIAEETCRGCRRCRKPACYCGRKCSPMKGCRAPSPCLKKMCCIKKSPLRCCSPCQRHCCERKCCCTGEFKQSTPPRFDCSEEPTRDCDKPVYCWNKSQSFNNCPPQQSCNTYTQPASNNCNPCQQQPCSPCPPPQSCNSPPPQQTCNQCSQQQPCSNCNPYPTQNCNTNPPQSSQCNPYPSQFCNPCNPCQSQPCGEPSFYEPCQKPVNNGNGYCECGKCEPCNQMTPDEIRRKMECLSRIDEERTDFYPQQSRKKCPPPSPCNPCETSGPCPSSPCKPRGCSPCYKKYGCGCESCCTCQKPFETPYCVRCRQKVYAAEKVLVKAGLYHNSCFSCRCCSKPLDVKTVNEGCGEIFCRHCYRNFFGINYVGYGSHMST